MSTRINIILYKFLVWYILYVLCMCACGFYFPVLVGNMKGLCSPPWLCDLNKLSHPSEP